MYTVAFPKDFEFSDTNLEIRKPCLHFYYIVSFGGVKARTQALAGEGRGKSLGTRLAANPDLCLLQTHQCGQPLRGSKKKKKKIANSVWPLCTESLSLL